MTSQGRVFTGSRLIRRLQPSFFFLFVGCKKNRFYLGVLGSIPAGSADARSREEMSSECASPIGAAAQLMRPIVEMPHITRFFRYAVSAHCATIFSGLFAGTSLFTAPLAALVDVVFNENH